MTNKVHDDVDANLGENIIIPPMPSSTAGATGETILYQMCNCGIRVGENCSRLAKFIVHSVTIYVCK